MKRKIFIPLLILCTVLASCEKEPSRHRVTTVNYYLSGNETSLVDGKEVSVPVIYKNDEVLYRNFGANSVVKDIIIQDKQVYACGYSIGEDGFEHLQVWKNGQSFKSDLNELKGRLNAALPYGTQDMIYIGSAGNKGIVSFNGNATAFEYQAPGNQEVEFLRAAKCSSSEIIIAGKIGRKIALWKLNVNSSSFTLDWMNVISNGHTDYDNCVYELGDMDFSNKYSYLALTRIDAKGEKQACYAIGDTIYDINTPTQTAAYAIAANSNFTIIGGSEKVENKMKACVWSYKSIDFSNGLESGDSKVFHIAIDPFGTLHFAMHTAGVMQYQCIYDNNEKSWEFKCDPSFRPEGWALNLVTDWVIE